jgi:electron transport complex protein RnfG
MLRNILSLTIVSLLSGLLLSFVDNATSIAREEQNRLARLSAVKSVLPGYSELREAEVGGVKVYITDRGIAFSQTTEAGYSGKIIVMIGFLSDGSISNIEIVRHAETPGLGSKIEEEGFKSQFSRITEPVAVKKDGGKIDAITGATISSRAVCEAVNSGLLLFSKIKRELEKKE